MEALRRTMIAPTIAFAATACAATTLLLSAMDSAWAADANNRSSSSGIAALEQQFRELPPDARRLTGPLFWLHGDDSKERLEMYVGKVAEGGNGSFTTESRPHTDWMGPGWWRDLDICLAAAKKQNLQLWIFDEKWWPSQAVAGKVPPRYAAKRLEAATVEVEGPRAFEAEGYGGERYVAAVAGRVMPMARWKATRWLIWHPTFKAASFAGRPRTASGASSSSRTNRRRGSSSRAARN